MSADSSRQVTVRSGESSKNSGDSSTIKLPNKGEAAVQIAFQPTLAPEDVRVPVMTIQPGSGRPNIARLPIIEKEVYRIEGEVAQGGIGRVLSARDERLDRRVAVKVLLEDSGAYEDRFVREALVTARLQHPSIVPVYEAGRWPSGEPFYSMKLVSGKPLLDVIEQSRTLDERLPLLTRVLAVADAVAYAHERRIIHRDLKPANILVGAHGETILIDWGLAKDLNEANVPSAVEMAMDANAPVPENNALTMIGSVMGTPSYMPPEQAAGDAVDERADVYALGAILYHVLSGTQPYAGYSGMQTIMRVLEEPPRALEALQVGIPRDLLTIIDKAMHRDRSARYPTAKEFAEDLRLFLAGQLVGAHHYSSRERALRFLRKHRTAFGVAAVAVVLMVMNGALFVSRIVKERDRAEAERRRAEVAREQSIVAEEQATIRADELTLVEARAAVERDPNAALAWLKALSPGFHKWNAARVIAADAWSRGTSRTFREHTAVLNSMVFSRDETMLLTASDDRTARLIDMATGTSRVFEGHTDEVWSASFSTDGQRVVTGGKDRSIRIWDITTGKTITTLLGHKGPVIGTIFSRDDKFLFSQSDDCSLRMWDIATGKDRIIVSDPKISVKSVRAPDEKHFVTAGNDGSMWYVGVDDAKPKRLTPMSVNSNAPHVGGIYPMGFSADGRYIFAGGTDAIVRIWDIEGEKLRVLEGQTAPIVRVAFSPDGHFVAAGSFDGSLRLWDLDAGTSRALPSLEANVRSLVFSPDGRQLAAGGYDNTVRTIDLSTGRRRRFVGMQGGVSIAYFSKDGSRLVAASGDGAVREFRVNQESGRLLGRHKAVAFKVDISPQADWVASAGMDGLVQLWPVHDHEPARSFVGHVGPVVAAKFSPNGEFVASAGVDGTVRLWDRLGHQIHGISSDGDFVPSFAFSPDGTMLAIGNSTGLVRLWNIDSGEIRELGRHAAPVLYVAFSADGKKLGTASIDRTAKVWDLASGNSSELRGHEHVVTWIEFAPDGATVATGSVDHRLRIWDPGVSEPRTYDASGMKVAGLSFLPGGKTLLSHSSDDAARLWDVQSGKTLRMFRGHRGMITSLALAQSGTVFATSSDDRTVRLYDIETGESRVMGVHEAPVRAVGIEPNGSWAVSAGDDGAVRLWSDELPREPEALRAWIAASVTDVIDVNTLGQGSVPLP
jgi:WD40 repeat protein/serine/threonine protein kinase